MSGCNDAAIKTHDSTASCRCLYTQRDRDREREREGEAVQYTGFGCLELYFFRKYLHCPFVADSHLASAQDGTTCQGLALGPRQSPLRSRLDFAADQWDLQGQTVCHCILPCMRQKNNNNNKKTQFGCTAPHLLYTCLNPDEDREGQLGERKRQKQGVSSSVRLREWFYSALSRR